MILNELLADGPITALHFHTGGGSSRAVRAFIAELSAAVLATGKKPPLVYTTDRELTAIFRFFQRADLRDDRGIALRTTGGQRFADIDGHAGTVHVVTQYGDADDCNISIPDGGKWLDNRSPDGTARHALPVFDSKVVSRPVVALLDKWADKLVDAAAPMAPRNSAVDIVYRPGTRIDTDPSDWDPTDVRRKDVSLIAKVRRLRRAVLGRDSGAVIEGPAGHSSDE